jgi:acetate kinase
MKVLVVNAGSSSLKLAVLDEDDVPLSELELPAPGWRFDDREAGEALDQMPEADAVGHRVVHGGSQFTQAVRIDAEVERDLASLVDLAPLHQRAALAGIELVKRQRPQLPGVACFDTAFHAHLPAAAATYPLPREWRERYGLRRYGFHGLSHSYATRRVAELLRRPLGELRMVSCHLGSGASLAAVQAGISVDTTMGFTPLEGLVMATRSGSIDPGMLLWLQQKGGMSVEQVSNGLEHRAGLLGLAGSADMREVLAGAEAGDSRAQLALDVYTHRLRASIAAMAAAMGGLDALVFTGGVGEHAPFIRQDAAEGLAFLGLGLDPERNRSSNTDSDVSSMGAAARTLVVTAREDIEIASQVRQLLSSSRSFQS